MDTKDIIGSFRQGERSANCVSVAVIKASVEVFGLTGVFQTINRTADEATVTMRDGIAVTVTQDEIDLATQKSGFSLGSNTQLHTFACFAFAVMAKRAQRAHHEGVVTYDEAIDALTNGESYAQGPEWLGLQQYVQKISKRDIWKFAGVVGASDKHCFLASFGWQDAYGTPSKITQFKLFFNPSKYQYFYRFSATPF
jgi:hypothetical protein